MLNKLLFVLLAILASNCVTEKRRQKICNSCPVIANNKDSIIEKLIEVPVIIPGVPGPTLYLENPCQKLCDSLGRLRDNIKFNIGGPGSQSVTVQNINGALVIGAATGPQTVAANVKQKEFYRKKESTAIKWMPCVNERTAFDGFTRWWFYITAAILIGFLGYRFLIRR